jgi:hypothetical protein
MKPVAIGSDTGERGQSVATNGGRYTGAAGGDTRKRGKSAVTNGKRHHTGSTDGRTRHARRWRDLFLQFKAQLGHEPSLSEMALLKTAASLALSIELTAVELANGKLVDNTGLSRASGNLRRALQTLGLTAGASDRGEPGLSDLLGGRS